jgi:hypothetical protein
LGHSVKVRKPSFVPEEGLDLREHLKIMQRKIGLKNVFLLIRAEMYKSVTQRKLNRIALAGYKIIFFTKVPNTFARYQFIKSA